MDVRDKQSLPLSANQHVDFVAIDFETATSDPNSACAVGLAFVVGLRVVATTHHLIQPPGNRYDQGNIHVHGIYPEDTEHAPDFLTVWQELHPLLAGKALIAHNARFDMLYFDATEKVRPQKRKWTPAGVHLKVRSYSLISLFSKSVHSLSMKATSPSEVFA